MIFLSLLMMGLVELQRLRVGVVGVELLQLRRLGLVELKQLEQLRVVAVGVELLQLRRLELGLVELLRLP